MRLKLQAELQWWTAGVELIPVDSGQERLGFVVGKVEGLARKLGSQGIGKGLSVAGEFWPAVGPDAVAPLSGGAGPAAARTLTHGSKAGRLHAPSSCHHRVSASRHPHRPRSRVRWGTREEESRVTVLFAPMSLARGNLVTSRKF